MLFFCIKKLFLIYVFFLIIFPTTFEISFPNTTTFGFHILFIHLFVLSLLQDLLLLTLSWIQSFELDLAKDLDFPNLLISNFK